jgi:D-alanine-D-alanine ligase
MSKGTVAVVFGGPSPEHEISILTGLQAERVLRDGGYDVAPVYFAPSGSWYLVPQNTEAKDFLEGPPKAAQLLDVKIGDGAGLWMKKGLGQKKLDVDAALLCFHGGAGEGGGAAFVFELLDIPHTGSTLYAGAVGMDKLAFGAMMANAGIPTLPRVHLSEHTPPPFPGPYIVKPRFGGSSIGIEVVDDMSTATALASSVHLKNGAVVEPYRSDLVDLNMAFRTYPALALTPLEKPLRDASSTTGLYSYQEKYLQGGGGAGLTHAPREFPANVPSQVTDKATELVTRVADVTRLTGVVRVDLLFDEKTGDLFVNEVNTIPGALSLYLWTGESTPFQVLHDALTEAVQRRVVWPQAGFSQGVALRAAGGIAQKLTGMSG